MKGCGLLKSYRISAIAALLLCTGTCIGQNTPLTNPIVDAPDPFVTRYAGQYLLLATRGKDIKIWASKDIASLGEHPHVVWTPPDDMAQMWSPTLWKMNGSWWIYFTAKYPDKKHAIYVLQSNSSNPLGAYTFRGELPLGNEAIDPSILTVKHTNYLMYVAVEPHKWNAVWITPLPDPLRPSGPGNILIFPDQPWERGAPTTHNYPVAEGPTALYHHGRTFIVYSGSDTGTYVYCLGLFTYSGHGDPTLSANWRKTGPVFSFSAANHVFGPGRGTFTTSPDGKQDWLLYHAKDSQDYTYAHRTTRAQPFTWNPDGTPDFGVPVPLGPLPSSTSTP